jgi:hypothetical protein
MIYIPNAWLKPCPKRLLIGNQKKYVRSLRESYHQNSFTHLLLLNSWCFHLIHVVFLSLSLSSLINTSGRVERRSRPARLQLGLPNDDCWVLRPWFPWGGQVLRKKQIFVFSPSFFINYIVIHQFTDVLPYLLGMDCILPAPLGLLLQLIACMQIRSTRNTLLHFDLEIALTGSPVWFVCTSTEHTIDARRPCGLRPHRHRNYPTPFGSFLFSPRAWHQLMVMVSSPDFTTKITRISFPKIW